MSNKLILPNEAQAAYEEAAEKGYITDITEIVAFKTGWAACERVFIEIINKKEEAKK